MKRKLVLSGSALLSLLCVAGVQAEEGGVSGHVEATGKSIDVSGNKAKFSEYGDADSGITGGVEMKYDAESGFLNFNADEIARDTQNFKIEAGQYEKFKLDAYYKEIQHNFDFDARSFYTGVGTNNLTTTATSASLPTNAAAWPSVFDYAISRDQYGAGIKLNMLKPFFAAFPYPRKTGPASRRRACTPASPSSFPSRWITRPTPSRPKSATARIRSSFRCPT